MSRKLLTPLRLSLAIAVSAAFFSSVVSGGTISTLPPLIKTNVDPNVMFTLDDSGSMRWEQMPDLINPGDIDNATDSGDYGFFSPTLIYSTSDNASLTATKYHGLEMTGVNVKDRRYRSASVNKIYYNPDVTYKTWVDSTGVSMAAATPAAVKYAPILPGTFSGGTLDLTSVIGVAGGNITAAVAGAYHSTYYNYTGGGTCPAAPTKDNSTLPAGETALCFTKVEIKPSVTSYPHPDTRTDCGAATAGIVTCNYTQEIQNFANWFQFWRSRMLLARGGIGLAFAKQTTGLRVGWASINLNGNTAATMTPAITGSRVISKIRQDFGAANRVDFYDWLYKTTTPNNGTTLRETLQKIGEYFTTQTGIDGPWADTINSSSTSFSTCRQNYNILTTDGYWNTGTITGNGSGNEDGTSSTIAAGTAPVTPAYTYTPGPPYTDATATSATLADVAMYYWKTDMRPSMTNNVPTSAADPAFWQHLVNFTVGMGVDGTLNKATQKAAIAAGTATWPAAVGNTPTAVDDLWHAAVNSRGEYYSAADPEQFARSLAAALQRIADRSGDAAAVGTSSNTVRVGTTLFTSTYRTADWSGDLTKVILDPSTGAIATDQSAAWPLQGTARTATLPAIASRLIFTRKTVTGVSTNVTFAYANLNTANQTIFANAATTAGATTTELVNYLKGGPDLGKFRSRTRPFGDFVNSAPEYLREGDDEGYIFLPVAAATAKAAYPAFLTAKLGTPARVGPPAVAAVAGRQAMVYVGSNDGMLHAINADTGVEVFAYIPEDVLPSLPNLASKTYTHQFYVDGTPSTGDYWNGSAWKTALVGTTGAGGRSVFALDVSDPNNFAASNVLWEVNAATDSDIGYTIGRAQIGRMPNGDWVAVFGNGYDSTSGIPTLFIVKLTDGTVTKVATTAVAPNMGAGNVKDGLSTPRLIFGPDASIKTAYAGDLSGKLWKFNFTTSGVSVAYSTQPLFTTEAGQPITVQPEVIEHPIGGTVVLFGTGKVFDTTDQANTVTQSLYGIWDNHDTPSVTESRITTGIAALQNHPISANASGTIFYTVTPASTTTPVNWATKRGWYINLDIAASLGERVSIFPQTLYDQILFTTIIPSSITDPCVFDGRSTTLQLDAVTGTNLSYRAFDTDGTGGITSSDTIKGGVQGTLTFGTTILRKGKTAFIVQPKAIVSGSNNLDIRATAAGGVPTVRLWRQILGKQ